jgi:hypothetical protein
MKSPGQWRVELYPRGDILSKVLWLVLEVERRGGALGCMLDVQEFARQRDVPVASFVGRVVQWEGSFPPVPSLGR